MSNAPARRPARQPDRRPDRYGKTDTARTAFAPSVLAAIALLIATALIGTGGFTVIEYVVSILALIVLVFAVQGRAFWAVPLLVAVVVLWNPVVPFGFRGPWWFTAQVVAAVVFVVIGVQVKVPTGEQAPPAGRGRR